ncbi:MAG: glucans biosynthesis glucosyltransferase MdoH [Myxococcaceae bacterium]|nr:glucans biosynthesis glucosyltransferase MdoH [Myxococcaceae bacterium]
MPIEAEVARVRRFLVLAPTAVSTALATLEMRRILDVKGMTVPAWAMVVLFCLCFGWIALWFWTSVAGFLHLLFRRRLPGLMWPEGPEPLRSRTAVVMPIHNEDPAAVFAHLQAVYESVAATGQLGQFEFYVLSDSTRAEAWVGEELAWADLCRRVNGQGRIFYRRRHQNTGKKAGNLQEFCERWGRRNDFMVVLDADSLMRGETLVTMARLMELNPQVGILQAPPLAVGRRTLFARLQQFAGRLYGPLISAGMAWWQLGESNYWGHNAIIRVKAFIEHCGLPVLPGEAPFGGHILSHDFVEAALMRRGGYQVWLVPELGGSYEQPPPELLAYAQRDRRWCQGNLQHMRLIAAGGLHPMSRGHFLMGVMSYLASPLLLAFLLMGLIAAAVDRTVQPDYFPDHRTLFPIWPVFDVAGALRLMAMSMGLLFVPKALALVLALLDGALARRMGGRLRLIAGVVFETLLTTLMAPVMMVFQSWFVVGTITGHRVSWTTQQREDEALPWAEAARRLWPHTILGAVLAWIAAQLSDDLLLWYAPIAGGLLWSIPLTVWTSCTGVADGLLLIPEETAPDPVLVRAKEIAASTKAHDVEDALDHVLTDVKAHAIHLALLEDQPGRPIGTLALASGRRKLLEGRTESLTTAERAAVLLDARTLSDARILCARRPGPAEVRS